MADAVLCELEGICRFAPCHIWEICKFRDEKLRKTKSSTPPREGGRTAAQHYTTSQEDMKKVRNYLKRLVMEDKVGPNQIKALEKTKGMHYKNLTDVDKEQILSILQDVLKGVIN